MTRIASLLLIASLCALALTGCSPPDTPTDVQDAATGAGEVNIEMPGTDASAETPTEPTTTDGPTLDQPANTPPPADPPAEEPVEDPAEQPAVDEPAETSDGQETAGKSKLLVQLPSDYCNTPDGMVVLPDSSIIVSMPNFNDTEQPACLVKITPDNQCEKFYDLPPHPDTGQFGPLGITLAPSGDLYLADFQKDDPGKSRVVRIVMKEGKPVDMIVVASGFTVSNAVEVRGDWLYVTETQIDTEAKPATSGILRFRIGEEGVELKQPLTDDPHFIGLIECHDAELPLGADGMCFDDDGNLYVSVFSDGKIFKIALDENDQPGEPTLFAEAECMKCADGLDYDAQRKVIYVADSRANAIHAVTLDGQVSTIAQNGDTDGLDGGMDQPCEVRRRGNTLIVSNMDWPVPGCVNQQYNEPATLSVIELEE